MHFHRILLLTIPGIYLVVPLLIDSWQSLKGPWYLPYTAWLLLILITFFVEQRRKRV